MSDLISRSRLKEELKSWAYIIIAVMEKGNENEKKRSA